jgi:hypothetical protein
VDLNHMMLYTSCIYTYIQIGTNGVFGIWGPQNEKVIWSLA